MAEADLGGEGGGGGRKFRREMKNNLLGFHECFLMNCPCSSLSGIGGVLHPDR